MFNSCTAHHFGTIPDTMIRTGVCLAVCLLLSSLSFSQGPSDELLNEALGKAGLSVESAQFDLAGLRFINHDEFVPETFRSYFENPFEIPAYAGILKHQVMAQIGSASSVVEICAGHLNRGTRRKLLGNPIERLIERAQSPNALADAIKAVYAEESAPDDWDVRLVPAPVQQQAALIILAAIEAKSWRDRALSQAGDLQALFGRLTKPVSQGDGRQAFWQSLPIMRSVDLKLLIAGAHDLIAAVEEAARQLSQAEQAGAFAADFDTPWGRVALRGGGNDRYEPGAYLLIIDTGGDDVYLGGGATASAANFASVLIDLGGNDRYVLGEGPVAQDAQRKNAGGMAFGGGCLGYGVVFDLKGNDVYRSASAGMGSGEFGVGVLVDHGGKDLYDGYAGCQGSATFGVGALIDHDGDDRYLAFQTSQGFGGTMGFGLLLDLKGNDVYEANDAQIDFPSPQTAEHNANLSQGMGYGRRGDYIDGHSLGGGFGALIDASGDDQYSCGLFGQGAGYWNAMGMLLDLGGNDEYKGVWYVQGSAAHFGIGYLMDESGGDSYSATMNMAQGAGHDFSIGYLLDRAGDDRYDAPSLALGGGNANGIGVFCDLEGNDRYSIRSNSANLGRANPSELGSHRGRSLCLGLFIDGAGEDVYPADLAFAGNGLSWLHWSRKNDKASQSQVGVGLDR